LNDVVNPVKRVLPTSATPRPRHRCAVEQKRQSLSQGLGRVTTFAEVLRTHFDKGQYRLLRPPHGTSYDLGHPLSIGFFYVQPSTPDESIKLSIKNMLVPEWCHGDQQHGGSNQVDRPLASWFMISRLS
jgi:hypothetical protein